MTDFLLELRSEEIPSRMQARARADLEKLFAEQMAAAGLAANDVTTYATPRRLALIARGLPEATQAVSEELKGPPEGAPDAAIEGFCRKAGLDRSQLTLRDVKGRNTWFAVIDKPGRATAEVLAEAIPAIVRAFPWPKSMRWGDASASTESLRWVRPLQGIVALLGEDVVPCEVAGLVSGAATVGHRFHHPGPITIGSASDYVEKLRACHVIVDQNERAATIALGAKMAASQANLVLVEDEALLAENAGLTEFPVPLLGSFDPKLLGAPKEILELTLKVNQKYFSVRDADGAMAPNFVCVANIDAADGGERIVAGNRKVAEARLSDAIFFWEQDRKVPLAEQAKKLDRIVFHEKLGTVADKAARVGKLARWLVEEGIILPGTGRGNGAAGGGGEPQALSSTDTPLHHPSDGPPPRAGEDQERAELAALAEQAGQLCKADLVTQTVGEFPEVQGIIGYELAKAQDLPLAVAEAIRDHYKPVGQGDEVPTAPVSLAVALADKLDTISAFFAIDQKPTGSKDPFALRRAALGILQIVQGNGLRFPLDAVRPELVEGLSFLPAVKNGASTGSAQTEWWEAALDFFADRLKVQQREAGVRHDLIDAVFALGGEDDLVRLLARVHALQGFVETDEGANLLAGYKRAANILKKEGFGAPAQAGAVAGGADQSPALRPSPEHGGGAASAEYDAASTSRHPGRVPGATAQQAAAPDAGAQTPEQVRGDGAGGADDVTGATALPYAPEPAEAALIAALDAAEPRAAAAIEAEDFEGAMAALASLRAPIDAFFDDVTVNDSNEDKRAARLALLARMRDAVHRVADFSRIEG